MDVTVTEATLNDEPTFRNLFQFYLYDFSRFMYWHVTYAGRFTEIDLDGCWIDPNRQPFLIRLEHQLAGFAIVDTRSRSDLSEAANVREMSEFFILAAMRRRGVGALAATMLFDRFPGRWEVRQLDQNAEAIAFWHTVIDRYTDGRFNETHFADPRWHGPVQFFDNSAFSR